MSVGLKRSAEYQLSPDNSNDKPEQKQLGIISENRSSDSNGTTDETAQQDNLESTKTETSTEITENPWKSADPEELAQRKILSVKSKVVPSEEVSVLQASTSSQSEGLGFLAYASKNPFATAIASSQNFGSSSGGGLSSTFGSDPSKGFGVISSFSSSAGFNKASDRASSQASSSNPKGLTVETKSNSVETPLSLVTPSPKAERTNPFSSTSPKVNPFVKIVDSKDELWLERTASTTSQSSHPSSSSKVMNSTIPVKSFFSAFKDSKGNTSSSFSIYNSVGANDTKNTTQKPSNEIQEDNNQQLKDDNDDGNGDDDEIADEEEATGPILTKVYQLPENVVVVTGEEDEVCILPFRAKLYRWVQRKDITKVEDSTAKEQESESQKVSKDLVASDGNWVEVGVGPVRILKEKAGSLTNTEISTSNESSLPSSQLVQSFCKVRIVMRREERKGGHGTKLLLNVPIRSYMTCGKQGDKAIRLTCLNSDDIENSSLQTYVLRTKSIQESEDAMELINSFIEEAKKVKY